MEGDSLRSVIDTNVLVQFLRDEDPVELRDPESNALVTRASDRAAALIKRIEDLSGRVIIPAPVLAEYLVGIERNSYQAQIEILGSYECIEIISFDEIAAIECALLVDEHEHKLLDPTATKAKIRVDRQIIATALATNAHELWTHDRGLFKKVSSSTNIIAKSLSQIEPEPNQFGLDLAN